MGNLDKEYGEGDDLDGLVPPSSSAARGSSSLELEDDYDYDASYATPRPRSRDAAGRNKSLLFYVATVQAFAIIYRTEVFLGCALATSIAVAITTIVNGKARGKRGGRNGNPFEAARIEHDYTSIASQYDLTLGFIDHWCLRGDDNNCKCDDPLEPSSRRSNPKWEAQHKENIKVAQAALTASLSNGYGDFGERNYVDDNWIDGFDDDWVYGEGSRFGPDDYARPSSSTLAHTDVGGWDDRDDGYAIPMPLDDDDGVGITGDGGGGGGGGGGDAAANNNTGSSGIGGGGTRAMRRRMGSSTVDDEIYELDVVFVGDSITEQRQGTVMGKPNDDYTGIKEVFDKTFTKKKGGDFNGIAMGISGDTSPNLLWRLKNGEMPYGLTPRVWWVGIGINDLSLKGCSEEVTLLGILRVVEEIQIYHPEDFIVINSLLPVQRNQEGLLEHTGKHHEDVALKKKEQNMETGQMNKKRDRYDIWPSIVSINKELSEFASKHQMIKFFNTEKVFVEDREDGKYMKLDLFGDPVHPNLAGHKKWNAEIKKKLHEILKDKP
ncbi:hypothetical protein ACHAXA_011565 [Cyclostephanos tholiformis]|uniref:SGNH hydrolase-type esterase domain-containing protein n=1 Tax=Cyclostephanos tholiformis TaxID=382380 RepID=A0ABD3SH22_9STRA